MSQKLVQRPTNKVGAGVLAGAIAAILVWAMRQFGKVEVPAEIAMAATTVITFVVQQKVADAEPEEAPEADQPTQPMDRP